MFKLWFCTFVICTELSKSQHLFDENHVFSPSYRNSQRSNDKQTVYTALGNFDVDSTLVADRDYPWIGRVVHSQLSNYPHMCTASCINERIFITAADCISTLKVIYTTVIYNYQKLRTIAFVVPTNGSQQGFDDIGFIIVHGQGSKYWPTVKLFDTTNRTDNAFQWFSDLFHSDEIQHKVVGYSVPKNEYSIVAFDKQYKLSELPVVVNINLCPSILTFNNLVSGFLSPCYHSCSFKDHTAKAKACERYHGVEGGAVFNTETKKLLGIATWGPTNRNSLPVGFAVPNSENFFKDYDCAKRIRNNAEELPLGYQSLCNI